jgi:N-acetyl-alpha-D-glucosaminyl L-malate synthase BshA
MIGDGPERVYCEQLCRDLNVCDDVRFLGKQEMIEEILSVCDLFFMPSETESFGLAALEAMACQVPVISTNSGGMPELNVQGVTGYLSNVGDVEDMAKNSIQLLLNEEKLMQFKKNALAHAATFNIDRIRPMYERLYEQCLEAQAIK